jgi:hypothetical protein
MSDILQRASEIEQKIDQNLAKLYLFFFANVFEPLVNLGIGGLHESQYRTPTLDWLNDLRRIVARECKPSSCRVKLHGSTHGLLCRRSHTARRDARI